MTTDKLDALTEGAIKAAAKAEDPVPRLVAMTLDLLHQRGEFEKLAKLALAQRDAAMRRQAVAEAAFVLLKDSVAEMADMERSARMLGERLKRHAEAPDCSPALALDLAEAQAAMVLYGLTMLAAHRAFKKWSAEK